nr:immunoglobulin light chain junction region [Macaca mulatta]
DYYCYSENDKDGLF